MKENFSPPPAEGGEKNFQHADRKSIFHSTLNPLLVIPFFFYRLVKIFEEKILKNDFIVSYLLLTSFHFYYMGNNFNQHKNKMYYENSLLFKLLM